jgi:hypothetical protein
MSGYNSFLISMCEYHIKHSYYNANINIYCLHFRQGVGSYIVKNQLTKVDLSVRLCFYPKFCSHGKTASSCDHCAACDCFSI